MVCYVNGVHVNGVQWCVPCPCPKQMDMNKEAHTIRGQFETVTVKEIVNHRAGAGMPWKQMATPFGVCMYILNACISGCYAYLRHYNACL